MPKPVSRRVSLPGAAELFRTTQSDQSLDEPRRSRPTAEDALAAVADPDPGTAAAVEPPQTPQASGRVRHDQKITVYFSSEELFALEDATLDCKRAHGLRVDRGRLVRSAVALALADLAERGAESDLVAALRVK